MHEEETWPFVRVRCLASCAGPAEPLWWHTEVEAPSLVDQTVKNPPAMWETWVWSLAREDPLEKEMATRSSPLAWRIPMDRGAWRVTVHGTAESDTAQRTRHRTSIQPFFPYLVTATESQSSCQPPWGSKGSLPDCHVCQLFIAFSRVGWFEKTFPDNSPSFLFLHLFLLSHSGANS